MRASHSGSEPIWVSFSLPKTLLFWINFSWKEEFFFSGVFSRTKNAESQSDLSKQAYHIYHHRLLNQPRTQTLDQIWLQRNFFTASTLYFLFLRSKKKEEMWEEAESDIYLWTTYLGKEMRDVTAIFAVSRLKIKRGLVPVAASLIFSTSIFSTQCCCSALVCLWYWWTWLWRVSVGLQTTHGALVGSRGDCSPCDISKELLGTQQRKVPKSPRVLWLWHLQPVLLTYETTWSRLPGRKVRLSPHLTLSTSCRSVSHIHTQHGCESRANSLPAPKLSTFSQKKGGWKNTEPAGQSSGACNRITSNSAFFFRCLSPLGQRVGRRAKSILVRAKLYLVPSLEKLLIISPHPKGQKNTVDYLICCLFTEKQTWFFVLSSKMYSGRVQIYSLVMQREN